MFDEVVEDGIRRWPTEDVSVSLLDGQDANPNEMNDVTFSKLVEGIQEKGFLEAIQVVGPNADGRYTIVGGHHRVKAAMVLGMETIPALIVPEEEFTKDEQEVYLVRMNILRGELNPQKFTDLFNRLGDKYGVEYTREMMAFTRTDAFNRVYLDAKKSLPPEMQEKLAGVREEMKTVDDLSLVLNKLFTEYGSTLDFNGMFFTYGGRTHAMIQLSGPGQWNRVKRFIDWCVENKLMINDELMTRMSWPKGM